MTDPSEAAKAAITNWKDSTTLYGAVADAIRKAQREGIEEGKRLAAARPGVDREKVLGLLEKARADVPPNAIVYIIAAVRLLVEGEK